MCLLSLALIPAPRYAGEVRVKIALAMADCVEVSDRLPANGKCVPFMAIASPVCSRTEPSPWRVPL